jgi:hypothetical protein
MAMDARFIQEISQFFIHVVSAFFQLKSYYSPMAEVGTAPPSPPHFYISSQQWLKSGNEALVCSSFYSFWLLMIFPVQSHPMRSTTTQLPKCSLNSLPSFPCQHNQTVEVVKRR